LSAICSWHEKGVILIVLVINAKAKRIILKNNVEGNHLTASYFDNKTAGKAKDFGRKPSLDAKLNERTVEQL
jgi:hypothetical protein